MLRTNRNPWAPEIHTKSQVQEKPGELPQMALPKSFLEILGNFVMLHLMGVKFNLGTLGR